VILIHYNILKTKNKKKLNLLTSKELKNKTVLITGGAGSIGSQLVKRVLEYQVKSVRVLDINEHALFTMNHTLKNSKLRVLLGSILDKERLEMAGKDVDIIIHVAAVKNIEITEFNPIETVETNINGTINVIKMALKNNIEKFVNLSTDKSVYPTTLYGATKHLGERLTSWAGAHNRTPKFGTIRLGNVFETKGNVFEIWDEELEKNLPLSVTSEKMKRYFFHMDEAVDFILNCIPLIDVGEIFVPKMYSFKIKELASKLSDNYKIIGLRQGEKLEESLMTDEEKKNAKEKSNMWVINQY